LLELLSSFFRCPDSLLDGDFEVPVQGALANVLTHLNPSDLQRNKLPAKQCAEIVKSLLLENYPEAKARGVRSSALIRNLYYLARPLLGVRVRRHLQRLALKLGDGTGFPSWPIDFSADQILEQILIAAMRSKNLDRIPFIWFWPEHHSSCAIITHDVETAAGLQFCSTLMDIDESFGFKSSFQLIPEERYHVTDAQLSEFRRRGFEVNVHDLNHDGRLYEKESLFLERLPKINEYGRRWGSKGFRAGALYRNQKWFGKLKFEYEMSVPNSGRYDAQRGGCCTVFPYVIAELVEMPVTLVQDYTVFNILNENSVATWEEQLCAITDKSGLVNLITHPDYLMSNEHQKMYRLLLSRIKVLAAERHIWATLPSDVNGWWRARTNLSLQQQDNEWTIVGDLRHRASIGYATLEGDNVRFRFTPGDKEPS
jgi:hypothetical protein